MLKSLELSETDAVFYQSTTQISSRGGFMNIRYFLLNSFLLPGRFEEVCPARDFDFITPQAFGRNTYPDDSFLLRLRNQLRAVTNRKRIISVYRVGALRDSVGSDMDAFKRLDALDFNPGCPNEILAEICLNLTMPKQAPIIGEWRAMYAIWKSFPMWYCLNQYRLVAIWPPRKGYLATRGMLLEVDRIAKERGLTKPCLVAHPEHMPRAYFLARKIFGKPVAMMTDVMSNEWFDRDSVQWCTRGRWRWLAYEMLARAHHRWFGWF